MGAYVVTKPTSEPVSLSELRRHLRVDGSDHDAVIASYVPAARRFIEADTRRALMPQTWALTLDDNWPMVGGEYRIDLPVQPVQAVTSITYVDGDGATQTLSSEDYALRNATPDTLAFIEPEYGVTWPAVRAQSSAITITFVAGYASATAVPAELRDAIKLQVELMFDRDSREAGFLERTRDALMSPYRVVRL